MASTTQQAFGGHRKTAHKNQAAEGPLSLGQSAQRSPRQRKGGRASQPRPPSRSAHRNHSHSATTRYARKNTRPSERTPLLRFLRKRPNKPSATPSALNANSGSQTTPWSCSNKRVQREVAGEHNAKQKRNQAKRSARKDKVNWVHAQLMEDPSAEHSAVWQAVRRQKNRFQGEKSHLIVKGEPVPWSKTHEAFRDHLQNTQWAAHQASATRTKELESKRPLRPQRQDEEKFTMEELQQAMAKLKPRKAPGPDRTANELFKLLDDDSTQLLQTFTIKFGKLKKFQTNGRRQ